MARKSTWKRYVVEPSTRNKASCANAAAAASQEREFSPSGVQPSQNAPPLSVRSKSVSPESDSATAMAIRSSLGFTESARILFRSG